MAWRNSGVIRHFCYIPGFCQICTREKDYHSRRHTIKTYAQKYKNVERGKRGFAKNLLLKIYKNLSGYIGKWEVIL